MFYPINVPATAYLITSNELSLVNNSNVENDSS